MSKIDDLFNKISHIDVPEDLPENDGDNPNETELKKNQHREIPKVYGPARPHRFSKDDFVEVYGPAEPFKPNFEPRFHRPKNQEFVAVYGPAEWFEPKPVEKDEEKPEDPEKPNAD